MTTSSTLPSPATAGEDPNQCLVGEIEQMPVHERVALLYWGQLGETFLEVVRTKGTPAMRAAFAPVTDPARRARLQELNWEALLRLRPGTRRALDPTNAWPLINQAVRASGLSEDICKMLVHAASAGETPEAVASILPPTASTEEN